MCAHAADWVGCTTLPKNIIDSFLKNPSAKGTFRHRSGVAERNAQFSCPAPKFRDAISVPDIAILDQYLEFHPQTYLGTFQGLSPLNGCTPYRVGRPSHVSDPPARGRIFRFQIS